ncbi:MAG: glutamate-ammonia-ligase adenylyltransferase, partial [Burkholderiaceae bacterium]
GYSSDLDVIFLYDDDDPEAPAQYAKLAQRFITWMTSHTPAGILFDIDIALRPDGASGLLVSTIAAFEKYQLKSAWVWEHQALTRARFCAGDTDIGQRFELLRLDVLRQPREAAPLQLEVRTMRDKMTRAHPAKDRQFDLKQDRGGMIDIEFIVQYLILLHASASPQLTDDIGNIALLKLAGELGLVDTALAAAVANAYRLYRKLQHHARLQGEEQALVAPERVTAEALAVQQLWRSVFGDAIST